MIEVMND